jgi:hypothetical protein
MNEVICKIEAFIYVHWKLVIYVTFGYYIDLIFAMHVEFHNLTRFDQFWNWSWNSLDLNGNRSNLKANYNIHILINNNG